MVSEHVPAMSYHWQNWRKKKANLRAQQTLQRPAGAEDPVWNSPVTPFPQEARGSRGAWTLPTTVLSLMTLSKISSCYSPAWPREQLYCGSEQPVPPAPPGVVTFSLFPSHRPAVIPECAVTILPPHAPGTMVKAGVKAT